MKYFIVADIHGFYNELQAALNKKGFDKDNENHIFVSLGDLTDRGPDSKKCIDFVNSLERKILIRGNHEDLIEDIFIRRCFGIHDVNNGTVHTFYQLAGLTESSERNFALSINLPDETIIAKVKENEPLRTYLDSCVDYAEVGKNIFVHGWIPCFDKWCSEFIHNYNWRKADPYMWKKARWLNGMSAWHNGYGIKGKTIWCGHWHSSWGHSYIHHDGIEFVSKIETFYIDEKTGKQEPHSRHDPFKDK